MHAQQVDEIAWNRGSGVSGQHQQSALGTRQSPHDDSVKKGWTLGRVAQNEEMGVSADEPL